MHHPLHDREICHIKLSGHSFGVKVPHLKEIQELSCITKIPGAPAFVSGFVNVRGKIHLVVDLSQLVFQGKEPVYTEFRKHQPVLIFKASVADSLGLMVDSVESIIAYEEDQIHDLEKYDLKNSGFNRKYVQGLLTRDGGSIAIIHALNLIQSLSNEIQEKLNFIQKDL